jgi:phage-related holin
VTALSTWRVASVAAGFDKRVWLWLTAFLIVLGINKQLDLQSLFTQEARYFLRALGLYGYRRTIQIVFIVLLIVAAIAALYTILRSFNNSNFQLKLAFSGLTVLVSFVILRAVSFHHVDTLLPALFMGLTFNFVFENIGLALISVAGYQRYRLIQVHIKLLKNTRLGKG